MPRSIYCSKCRKTKEKGCEQQSYCKVCKEEARKRKLRERREADGWTPKRQKTKFCNTCGALKENLTLPHCKKCVSARSKEYRLRRGITKRCRTGKCRCGKEMAAYSNCYCVGCASEWRRNYLSKNPKKKKALDEKAKETRQKDPLAQVKQACRRLTRTAVNNGSLNKTPCIKCGNEKSEAHHEDYMKPLEVIWLCRKHHAEHHKLKEITNA